MATKMVRNLMLRTYFFPAAPTVGAEPIRVGPGEAVPIADEHYAHVFDGGKNEAFRALLNGGHLEVVAAEKFNPDARPPALSNPESPRTPPQLDIDIDDKRVTKTTTRTTKPPVVEK